MQQHQQPLGAAIKPPLPGLGLLSMSSQWQSAQQQHPHLQPHQQSLGAAIKPPLPGHQVAQLHLHQQQQHNLNNNNAISQQAPGSNLKSLSIKQQQQPGSNGSSGRSNGGRSAAVLTHSTTSPLIHHNYTWSQVSPLQGTIDDCSCNVDTVDFYNNVKIFPRLRSLLVKDFFRYYKVNLMKECPFWVDDSKCAMRFCHVEQCEQKDIPPGLKGDVSSYRKYLKEVQTLTNCNEDLDVELGYLNTSISDNAHREFQKWADYDEAQDNFCISDDHEPGAEYVDLLLNPERYTGYRGESARRIWSSIYLENCFQSHSIRRKNPYAAMIPYHDMTQNEVCIEHRVFYRMISGLHSSINIHLCANYLLSEKSSMGFVSPTGVWGTNMEEFERRFSPQTTDNEGQHWLRNLYFAYLVELRALAKAAPYLRNEEYFTGREKEDREVRVAVKDLLNVIESFPSHFNESVMFSGGTSSVKVKNEFREKFMNISKIMDCVGCDKCRLWGKLQVQGMGTALKILFSGKFDDDLDSNLQTKLKPDNSQFKLKRAEIVALFNAFGRLSTSIHELEEFRQRMR